MATAPKKPEPPDIPTLVAMAAARSLRMSQDTRDGHIDTALNVLSSTAKTAHKQLIKARQDGTVNRLEPVTVDPALKTRSKRRNLVTPAELKRVDIYGRVQPSKRLTRPNTTKVIADSADPLAHLIGAPVVFTGAMSPPGKHHAEAFGKVKTIAERIQSQAFVGTTKSQGVRGREFNNLDEALRYCLTTEDKVKLWKDIHGVDNVLRLTNAYDMKSVQEQLGYSGPVVFAVGDKDKDRIDPKRFDLVSEGFWRSKSTPNFYMVNAGSVVSEDGPVSASKFRFGWSIDSNMRSARNRAVEYFGKDHPAIDTMLERYKEAFPAVNSMIQEDKRSQQSGGERLQRSMKQRTTALTSRSHSKPVDNNALFKKRAKRAAFYAVRRKLAPNYSSLSNGQKADIDKQVANHADLAKLTDKYFNKFMSKSSGHKKQSKPKPPKQHK